MLATTKRFYSKMVSFLTALVMACTTAIFTVSTASGADYSAEKIAEMVNEVAMIVNAEREAAGLQPLYVVPYLNEVASLRAYEASEYWGHSRPNGEYFVTAVDTNIIDYASIAENLAAGSDTAEGAMEQWRNSPKHWAAIVNEGYTHMGIGLAYNPDGVNGCYWYWCQIFSNDLRGDVEYDGQYLPSDKVIVPADEGDVNGDASVNAFDYLTLTEYLRKKQEGIPVYLNDAQLEAADCFKDGRITEADAKAMMRYILGEYKSLPYEF
ncbi:MAG: CAP domain-containing protein [Ruminococcus flavefaciens]|nr:CAP domain-containing protein [Ruminococcus flavefaciens]MCM1228495.1 CAP domain-containing protein [Ruminococcus flavefaciens]